MRWRLISYDLKPFLKGIEMSDEYTLRRAISLVKELRATNKWATILLSTEAFEEIASNFIYVYDDREKWIVIEKRIPLRLTSQLEAFDNLNAFEFFLTLIEQGRTCKEASQDVLGILRRCDGSTAEEVRLREELEAVKKERDGWREGCLLEAEQHGKTQSAYGVLAELVRTKDEALKTAVLYSDTLDESDIYMKSLVLTPATLPDRAKGLVEALEKIANGFGAGFMDARPIALNTLAEYRGGK